MKFDIDKLSSTLDKVEKDLHKIDLDENIKKYGTFLDSKKDVLQLYMLFIFFGINLPIIQQFPDYRERPQEYDPD